MSSVLQIVMWNVHYLPHTQLPLTKSRCIETAVSWLQLWLVIPFCLRTVLFRVH